MGNFNYIVISNPISGIEILFDEGKPCSCGVTYTTWGEDVKEDDYGYWFTCPICHSTMMVRKD